MTQTKKEILFTLDGECDRKNKLLRSTAQLTMQDVEKIDSGDLSLEDLEMIVKNKGQIFKYRTQITIHAVFPREFESRVNGYAYLIGNKNGSVGVRYGAIDEAKRQYLQRFLILRGFHYFKRAGTHDFTFSSHFSSRDDANTFLSKLRTKYDFTALRKLFFGRIDVFGWDYCGSYNVELSITVNAIPEENISQFLSLLNCKTLAEVEAIEEENRREREERHRVYELERAESEAKRLESEKIQRKQRLAALRNNYKQITARPAGDCSLCIVTDSSKLVVLKQFTLKNGKQLVRKFSQGGYNIKEYQQWNDLTPPHSAKDTSWINDSAIENYIAQGAVFSL